MMMTMSAVAMPVAVTASEMSESFSAFAFGMSPPKPTFICGWNVSGFSSATIALTCFRRRSSSWPPMPAPFEMTQRAIAVPSFVAK